MVDDLPSAGTRGGRQVGKIVFLIAVIFAAVAVIAEFGIRRPDPKPEQLFSSAGASSASFESDQERMAKYIGANACLECHPGESALHSRSGHARTLVFAERSPIVAWLNGKSVSDPRYPDVRWSYQLRDKRLVVDRTAEDRTESLVLEYALGSGKHGVTFVAIRGEATKRDPAGIEHRLSYLANTPRLDITPGQERNPRDWPQGDPAHKLAFGRPLSPEHLKACLGCHATMAATIPSNRLETAALIPNISCERCHGPGREHVDSARRGETELTMLMGHEPAQPWAEVNRCGECHRLPRFVSDSSIKPENPGIVRFQGVGVSMSACYAKGEGSLRCTTCHDPHDRASSDHSHYEAACLSCHRSAQAQKACPVSPAANCVNCHMPRREVRGNGFFTDHWIRKPTPERAEPPKSEPVKTSSTMR